MDNVGANFLIKVKPTSSVNVRHDSAAVH